MSNLTPSIPSVQEVTDPATAKILSALRERVLFITGQLPSVKPIAPLGPNATLSDLNNKIGEILTRLQS